MSKPNINIPAEFAVNGVKTPFSNAKIQDGFDRINPDVLAGDNLNQFIDDTYKGLNGVLELYKGAVLYDATETYTNKSLVFNITDGNIELYHSLQNNNVGNALTDTNYWELVQLGGSGEIGDTVWRLLPSQDAGKHLLDGALIQGTGATADFVNYIADLYADNPSANYFTDEGTWQSTVMSYGVCGKFVYDDVNNTVRLPKVTGIVEGTIDLNALGDLVEAGLPNITGTFEIHAYGARASGAFYPDGRTKPNAGTSVDNKCPFNVTGFNASRSSSIYGNSSTVQPQTIKGYYYIVIANTKKTNYTINIDNVMTDLNGKADVDFTNVNNDGIAKCVNWNMPYPAVSGWVPLTLPPANSTITMPEDGLLVFDTAGTIIGGYIFLTCGYYTEIRYVTETYGILRVSMKIPKGFVVQVGYVNAGSLERFGYYKMKGNM